jgi:hypothetical protein
VKRLCGNTYLLKFAACNRIEVEKEVTDNSSTNNSLDYAFAYLTLYTTEINKKINLRIADIDVCTKIKK